MDIAQSNRYHLWRTKMLRVVYPLTLLFGVCALIGGSVYHHLQSLLRLQAIVTAELKEEEGGYIQRAVLEPSGDWTRSILKFDRRKGTGLRGEPLEFFGLQFESEKNGVTDYAIEFEKFWLDPSFNTVRATDSVVLESQYGVKALLEDVQIDVSTQTISSQSPILVYSEAGIGFSADAGFELNSATGELSLFGAVAADMPASKIDF